MTARGLALFLMILGAGCGAPEPVTNVTAESHRHDAHSYGNPESVRVTHLDLGLEVLFEERTLRGVASLVFDRVVPDADELILDTRDLNITLVQAGLLNDPGQATTYRVGDADPILGAPLYIYLPPGTQRVVVEYETSPDASGLQWLTPEQTAGKQHPFMFTQSQAIHARSWIPLQDSPGVRLTYTARVTTPSGLRAVMSASNNPDAPLLGDHRFSMRQPIPSYLIALAVGDLAFEPLGDRAGVYAEPSVLAAAAAEFEDTEAMMQATERLYGPYQWERYDLLVLPPSFPFGGMENPRLTFATPTVLAGDKSLVSLVAHELAHSWSGNLVTNATWRDFWLNEGFTVYLERRIIEAIYGTDRERMEAVLGVQALRADLDRLDDEDEILHIDLTGRDPDDGMTQVAYEKGALFLDALEDAAGRETFDAFLRGYFGHFAFQSITTGDFLAYLHEHLLDGAPEVAAAVPVAEWLEQPGIPAGAPQHTSDAFTRIDERAAALLAGSIAVSDLQGDAWTTQEWLHFLNGLPPELEAGRLGELDRVYALTESGNAEIAHAWFLVAIRNGYAEANGRLEAYLLSIGRRKLIRPLYEALAATPDGRARALDIYERARPGYHPISVDTIDEVLGFTP
jgi:leukotriene-A4 hydrolase